MRFIHRNSQFFKDFDSVGFASRAKKKIGSIQYIIPESDILLPSNFFPNGFSGIIFFPNPLFFKFHHFLFNLHKQIGSFLSHFRIKHLLEKCENLTSPPFKKFSHPKNPSRYVQLEIGFFTYFILFFSRDG